AERERALSASKASRAGAAYAALAYVLWGLFPLSFRQLAHVPALDVLVHRVVWSLVFVLALLGARRQWEWLADTLRRPRVIGAFPATALLPPPNWLTHFGRVPPGPAAAAGPGYFPPPSGNVCRGRQFLL